MRLNIKGYFISRNTVLSLIVLLLFSVVFSFVIPQRFSTPEPQFVSWRQAHQAWLPVVERFGLDHVFTSPWFVVLLFHFSVSLAIAVYEQFGLSFRKTFSLGRRVIQFQEKQAGKGSLNGVENYFDSGLPEKDLKKNLLRKGYVCIAHDEKGWRFVKNPWGYWGNFLLHFGMLIIIASSLLLVAVEKRGALRLFEGETHAAGAPWLYEERGVFAGPFVFPEAVRLDNVTPEFWEPGGLKGLSSKLTFFSPGGVVTRTMVAINSMSYHLGVRIYQQPRFGTAFNVILTDSAGEKGQMTLDLAAPVEKDKASYGTFEFVEIPYIIKAKYYADAEKKSLVSDNPLLSLRLVDQDKIIAEISMKKGESTQFGPYEAYLSDTTRWADFIFLDTMGMPGVFFGFFLFILGGVLHYFTVPRELFCQSAPGGYRLFWRGGRGCLSVVDENRKLFDSLRG